MSGLNRYFLMFASMYGCVIAYFVLNNYSLGPPDISPAHATDGAVLIAGAESVGSLRGHDLSTITPVVPVAATAAPQALTAEEEQADDSGVTDIVSDVVKCRTTHGDLIIDVRPSWAPLGSARFVELVNAGHFTDLPFYRVCPKYLTQFGKRYYDSESFDPIDLPELKDDPSLVGIRDMDYGYLFLTGNLADNRKSEMAISFCEMDNCRVTGLGTKSWEVPVASIRHGYFETLDKIMQTGFPYPKLEVGSMNGKGPDLEKLQEDRNYLKNSFPEMAYFQWCKVAQKNTKVVRSVEADHPTSVQLKKGKLKAQKDEINSAAAEKKEVPAAHDDDEETESKSLEEYLLGGESRGQRLEGRDAMSLSAAPAKIEATPKPTPRPKPPVLPSGLAGTSTFRVKFELRSGSGSRLGDIVVEIHPEWSPLGTKRFKDLVEANFFDECRFFRAIKGFVLQFGIPAVPLSKVHPWARLRIPDDPVATSNVRGTLSFASSGKNSRSNQLFFNINDNAYLDKEGFAPIGRIIEGVELLDKVSTEYGDKPNQGKGNKLGNEYFKNDFPGLTFMESVRVIPTTSA